MRSSARRTTTFPVTGVGLSGTKKFAGKIRRQELMAAAAGTVQDQHRICSVALSVTDRLPQRCVVKPHIRQGFAGMKFVIVYDEIAFSRGGLSRRGGSRLRASGKRRKKKNGGKHAAAKTKRRSNHQSPRRRKIYHNAIQRLSRRL